MLTRRLWEEELKGKWNAVGYWDDWLREPEQRKGRQVLAPEIFHFGRVGTSNGQFSKLLEGIKLNEDYVDFSAREQQKALSHVRNTKAYDAWLLAEVCEAREVRSLEGVERPGEGQDGIDTSERPVRLLYTGKRHFESLAKRGNIFADEKAGVFRMAYKGIVRTCLRGHRMYLVPEHCTCCVSYVDDWPRVPPPVFDFPMQSIPRTAGPPFQTLPAQKENRR
jgi:alpha-1,3-mannosyl-glycoprotein beta-1,2-N-acetylglucosaminyltransferase